ncbi:hypothetical protein IRZ71_08180 [Flavobacterium sp. ANB]|uniref:hypothetical protein n=1 Tax=unclassified Flavobacterium TaxID=196869 RepID=UPI0012B85554|nr:MULTISPECIES: hypothetical protein [unclassified Flavobacterium]MBF4516316.1 hypothetical protein [Flavobacterium sp. ANB]MTD69787.1 hypothetical protein [Flavobacterium sp. LC2016-13]
MKKLVLACILLAGVGFQSCKKNETQTDAVKAVEEKIVSTQCYRAVYEKDTLDLKLNTLQSGKITGSMIMNVASSTIKTGEIKGEFHGDTLFADYTFVEVTNKNKTFKNPMAFLKKDKRLILGNGTMQTTMGVTYLVKDKPIDFDRVKYKFETAECAGKK